MYLYSNIFLLENAASNTKQYLIQLNSMFFLLITYSYWFYFYSYLFINFVVLSL